MHLFRNQVMRAFLLISISGVIGLLNRLPIPFGRMFIWEILYPLSMLSFYGGWFYLGYTLYQTKSTIGKRQKKPAAKNKRISPLRKNLLACIIVSLSFSALMGLGALTYGTGVDALQIKILLTTTFIGIYSLVGLACAINYERNENPQLLTIGLILSGSGLFVMLSVIWFELFCNAFCGKAALLILVWSITYAHHLLMNAMSLHQESAQAMRAITYFFIYAVAGIVSTIILQEQFLGADLYRSLGGCAILDVFGTILTPLLEKMNK